MSISAWKILSILIVAALMDCPTWAKSPEKRLTANSCTVIDGDTVDLQLDGGLSVRVRLYGIDAPEGKQPGGNESTAALQRLVLGATKIEFAPINRDRYGRTVAILWADGEIVNSALIANGHAWLFPKYCKRDFCGDWEKLEGGAKTAGRGLWAKPGAVPPWTWRKTHK